MSDKKEQCGGLKGFNKLNLDYVKARILSYHLSTNFYSLKMAKKDIWQNIERQDWWQPVWIESTKFFFVDCCIPFGVLRGLVNLSGVLWTFHGSCEPYKGLKVPFIYFQDKKVNSTQALQSTSPYSLSCMSCYYVSATYSGLAFMTCTTWLSATMLGMSWLICFSIFYLR